MIDEILFMFIQFIYLPKNINEFPKTIVIFCSLTENKTFTCDITLIGFNSFFLQISRDLKDSGNFNMQI